MYSSLSVEKLNQMWDALDDHTCQYIIKSGARKGQHCGVPESECKTHSNDIITKVESVCQAIVKSGKPCGNKTKDGSFCGKHAKDKLVDTKINSDTETKQANVINSSKNKSDTESKSSVKSDIDPKPKSKSDMNTCSFVMKAGDRKGQACGKNTKEQFCSLHRPKETKTEKKENTTEVKPCALILKTGDRKGEVCGNTTQSCPHHQPLRIKKWGEYAILSNTTILFDKKSQTIIGYTSNEKAVFEENEDVRKASLMYDLAFVARA